MRSAYIKAVHVARIAEGAAVAQKRRDIMQQQQQQQSSLAGVIACGWSTTAQPRQKSTAVASSPCQGSAPVAPHLGKPSTFNKLLHSNNPAPGHSRLSSHETALADQQPQPLFCRPSTAASHTAFCHAPLSKWPCHAGRPATVNGTALRESHDHAIAGSLEKPKVGGLSPESVAALSANPVQDSSSLGSFSRSASSPRKALEVAESGSLDAALQCRSKTANEAWSAALSAADLGHLQEGGRSKLLSPDSPRHKHTSLTPSNMLRFALGDLNSSNESTPALSPRPPSRAIDFVPGLKARCAVADSNSPGITPRPVVHSRDLGVARFEGHPLRDAGEHVEKVRARAVLLAARLAAWASPENSTIETTGISKLMLRDQVGMTPLITQMYARVNHCFVFAMYLLPYDFA